MASWSQIENSPRFTSLSPDGKRKARDAFFNQYIAPQAPPEAVETAYQKWMNDKAELYPSATLGDFTVEQTVPEQGLLSRAGATLSGAGEGFVDRTQAQMGGLLAAAGGGLRAAYDSTIGSALNLAGTTAGRPDLQQQAEAVSGFAGDIEAAGTDIARAELAESQRVRQGAIDRGANELGLDILGALGDVGVQVASTLATRSPGVGASVAAGQVFGPEYARNLEEGMSKEDAAKRALARSGVEVGTTLPALGIVSRLFGRQAGDAVTDVVERVAGTRAGRIALGAGAEGGQETAAGVVGDAVDYALGYTDSPIGDLGENLKEGGIGAAVGGMIAAATPGRSPSQARRERIQRSVDLPTPEANVAADITAQIQAEAGVKPPKPRGRLNLETGKVEPVAPDAPVAQPEPEPLSDVVEDEGPSVEAFNAGLKALRARVAGTDQTSTQRPLGSPTARAEGTPTVPTPSTPNLATERYRASQGVSEGVPDMSQVDPGGVPEVIMQTENGVTYAPINIRQRSDASAARVAATAAGEAPASTPESVRRGKRQIDQARAEDEVIKTMLPADAKYLSAVARMAREEGVALEPKEIYDRMQALKAADTSRPAADSLEPMDWNSLSPQEQQAFEGMFERRETQNAERQLGIEAASMGRQAAAQTAREMGLNEEVEVYSNATGVGTVYASTIDDLEGLVKPEVLAKARAGDSERASQGAAASVRKGTYYEGDMTLSGKPLMAIYPENHLDAQEAAFTAAHEVAGHHGIRTLVDQGKQGTYKQVMEQARLNPIVAKIADKIGVDRKSKDKVLMTEEALAELNAALRTGDMARLKDKYGVTLPRSSMPRLRALLDRVIAALKSLVGRGGNTFSDAQVEALLNNAWKAAQSTAPKRQTRAERMSAPDAMEGRDQTKTRAFKRWFGDSKVVDANGEPLVVYHGTTADFDTFKPSIGSYGRGIYLTPSGEFAGATYGSGEGGNVMPVFAAIGSPYVVEVTDKTPLAIDNLSPTEVDGWLRKNGFDGIIVEMNGELQTVVALDPTQIKSATGNRGTFDPDSPSILDSLEPADSGASRVSAEGADPTLQPTTRYSPARESVRQWARVAEELFVSGRVSSFRGLRGEKGKKIKQGMRFTRDLMETMKGTKTESNQKGYAVKRSLTNAMAEDGVSDTELYRALETGDYTGIPEKSAQKIQTFRIESNKLRLRIVEDMLAITPYDRMTPKEKNILNEVVTNENYFHRSYAMDVDPEYANRVMNRVSNFNPTEDVRAAVESGDLSGLSKRKRKIAETFMAESDLVARVTQDIKSLILIPPDLRSRYSKYSFPAQVRLKDGSLSKAMVKWLELTGAEMVGTDKVSLEGRTYTINPGQPLPNNRAFTYADLKRLYGVRVGPPEGVSVENMIKELEELRAMYEGADYNNTVTELRADLAAPTESKIGAYFRGARADMGIVEARADVPQSFREFWGEIDPNKQLPLAAAITTQKMNALADNLKLLRYGESIGRREGWLIDSPKEGYKQLKGKTFGMLQNKYVPVNVAEMLEQQIIAGAALVKNLNALLTDNPEQYTNAAVRSGVGAVTRLAGYVKYNQVIMKGISWLTNGISNMSVMLANGNLPAMNGTIGIQGFNRGIQGVVASVGAGFRSEVNPFTSEITRNGLMQSPSVGDLNSALRKDITASILSKDGSWMNVVKRAKDAIDTGALTLGEAYAVLDLWATGANYFKNKDDIQKHWDKTGKTYSDMDLEFAAASLTRSTNFNWSMVPKILQIAERVGRTQFGPYFFETFRVPISNMIVGLQQMSEGAKTKDANYVRVGAARVAGAMAATKLNPIIAMVASALGASFLGDDEDEKGQIEAVVANNDFVSQPYLMRIGEKSDGTGQYFATGRLDSLEPYADVLYQTANGGSPLTAIRELLFANTLWTRLGSIYEQSGPGGDVNKIRSKVRSRSPELFAEVTNREWSKAAFVSLSEILMPSVVSDVVTAMDKYNRKSQDANAVEVAATALGLTLTEYHPLKSLGTDTGYGNRFDRTTGEAWRSLSGKIGAPASVTKGDVMEWYAEYRSVEEEAKLDLALAINAAKDAGHEPSGIAAQLRQGGVSRRDARKLSLDPSAYTYTPERMSDFLEEREESRLESSPESVHPAIKAEFTEKRRLLREVMAEFNQQGRGERDASQ